MGRAHSDAYYYLNLNPAQKGTPVYGKAFRFLSSPATPRPPVRPSPRICKTFFSSVQHPGEEVASAWPTQK